METIEIELPPPGRKLSPNGRPSRWRKSEAVRQYRGNAHIVCVDQMNRMGWRKPPKWERATVEVVYIVKTNRRRDRDNQLASLKPAFDGIADSGLVANDSGLTVLPVKTVLNVNAPRESVIITITKET